MKYKVNKKQMLALRNAHHDLLDRYEPDNAHEYLLLHFLKLFAGRFEKMINKDQKSYGLRFSEIELLAFCQLWADVDLLSVGYGGHVVQLINNEVDKERKSLSIKEPILKV